MNPRTMPDQARVKRVTFRDTILFDDGLIVANTEPHPISLKRGKEYLQTHVLHSDIEQKQSSSRRVLGLNRRSILITSAVAFIVLGGLIGGCVAGLYKHNNRNR